MDWKAHLAKSYEFEGRFLEKMPRTDDLTLLVLKGHLLIEELISSTIDGLLPNPDALSAVQLTCFARIRLLMSMLPDDEIREGTLEAFEKLNAIRNKFGHMLDPPQIEDHIGAFIGMVERRMQPESTAKDIPLPERLARAICFLCGQIEAVSLFYIGALKLMLRNTGYEDAASQDPTEGEK